MLVKLVREDEYDSQDWHLTTVEGHHNHERSIAAAAHLAYRRAIVSAPVQERICQYSRTGMSPAWILQAIQNDFPGQDALLLKDINNIL